LQLSNHRRAAKVDNNQKDIVKALRKVPGVSVVLDVNDILVGYDGKTYFYEIKETPKSTVKDSQYKLIKDFTGHYRFAFSVEDILQDIGVQRPSATRAIFNAVWHGVIYKGLTPAIANKRAVKAVERYKEQDFHDTPQQLIETMIEEAVK